MEAGTPPRLLVRALRRFWPVALLVTLVGGATAMLAVQDVEPTYTAEGTYIVPIASPRAAADATLPPSRLPNNAHDAGVLARTYEFVMEGDDALVRALAERTGLSERDLIDGAAVVNVPGTPVLRVTFTAAEEQDVQSYFASLTEILGADSPSENLPTGNVVPMQMPGEVERVVGVAGAGPVVGVVAGLLLGLAGAVLLERLDTRVRDAADLRRMVSWPVFALGGSGRAAAAEAVVLRILQAEPTTSTVAVVTVPGAPSRAASGVAAELTDATASLQRAGLLPPGAGLLRWEASSRLGEDGHADRGTQLADATVVVVPCDTRVRALTTALEKVEDLRLRDVTMVVPESAGQRGTRRAAGVRRSDAAPGRQGDDVASDAPRNRSAAPFT